jgi:homoserine acetyltransferase
VPVSLAQDFVSRIGSHARLARISSAYGHDAFIKEEGAIAAILEASLATEINA